MEEGLGEGERKRERERGREKERGGGRYVPVSVREGGGIWR